MENYTEKQVNDALLDVLMDVNNENKKIIKRQTKVIVFLISLLFASFCSFLIYLNQFDYSETITTTTKNDANTYDKNNTINAHINDININSRAKK